MPDFVFVKIDKAYLRLRFSDILYIQAENKYITVVTHSGSYHALSTMNHVEEKLPVTLFCRVHRSYIVSLEQISKFDNELVYMVGGKKIPLAEQYKSVLKNSVIIVNGDNGSNVMSENSNADKSIHESKTRIRT